MAAKEKINLLEVIPCRSEHYYSRKGRGDNCALLSPF